MSKPVIIVSGRHRPHELLLLVVSGLIGAAYTIGAPPPESVASLLPTWALHVWSAGLLLSGIAGLLGALTRRSWSLQIEQAGMLLGAASLIWYGAAVTMFGWRALFASLVCLAWALANLWRALQIRGDQRGDR